MNGFEVLRELRSTAAFSGTAIVALTASAMRGDQERALAAGFSAFLVKPMGLTALRREMQRLAAREEPDVESQSDFGPRAR